LLCVTPALGFSQERIRARLAQWQIFGAEGCKPVLHFGAQPPHSEDYPRKYSKNAGFSFETV
jgi:hypothetical protein